MLGKVVLLKSQFLYSYQICTCEISEAVRLDTVVKPQWALHTQTQTHTHTKFRGELAAVIQ